jgi:hypothetical protein
LYAPTSLPGGKWATTGFWLRIDGGDWIDMTVARKADAWVWAAVQSAWPDDYSDPLAHETHRLAAGTHTVDVAFANRGAHLDSLYATANRHTVPVGPRPLSAPAGLPGVAANGPTDPDGDGRFEDRTGDGAVTYADVVDLFDNFDDARVDPTRVDFNGNGRVDFADVVHLFDEVD